MAKKLLSHNRRRSAFTLVEALVAITVTLIMMLALSKGFVMMSQSISEGRSKISLSDQLRGISMKLREDLAGMTAGGDPVNESSRSGYFEYYEGPISDYLAALVNFDGSQTNLEQKNPASRYGDFDDILAFTAKAKKGQWFYGEVPYPVVMGPVQIAAGNAAPTFSAEEWARGVTVASDTAEIVYFMMPYAADSTQFPLDRTFTPPAVNFSSALLSDLTPNITPSATALGVPAKMILCRRVLLVLPELNVVPPSTSADRCLFYQSSGLNPTTQLHVPPLGATGSPILANYRIGMQTPYQRCDLSVRRASDNNLADYDPICANSLADLQDPKNRFAHTVLPISGTTNTTMPLFSLTGPIPLQVSALTGLSLPSILSGASTLQDGNFGFSIASGTHQPELGFLYPQFMRQRRTDHVLYNSPATEDTITYEMAFSEVLATNCIAFDVKGYDPRLTQWYHPGVNGVQEYGVAGSDDVVVSPSDPGYSNVISRLYSNWNSTTYAWNAGYPNQFIARTGGFADLGWAFTLRNSAIYENSKMPTLMDGSFPNTWATQAASTNMSQLSSAMSLTVPGASYNSGVPPFDTYALKSGKISISRPAGILQVYQPTFDTYTGRYEKDGYSQTFPSGYDGTIWFDGQEQYAYASGKIPFNGTTLPALEADRGANGIDDVVGGVVVAGVDDIGEMDATPPVGSPLRAVQITIRVEDKNANVIQQVVVDQDLRLEN